MKQFHVISLSVGTAVLFCLLTVSLVLAIVFSAIEVHSKTSPSPDVFRPKTGVMGELEHQINDLKYGPVNTEATKEVKNGLFDRIRANRQSRLCQPAAQQACSTVQSYSYCTPVQVASPAYRIVDPSDCNYSYTMSNPVVGQRVITQSTGIEMPISSPVNPFLQAEKKPCPTCVNSRNAVKTGAFICSNCRQSKIGEWHTDWNSDGTPLTFLCKTCHAFMTPDQRQRAFTAYQSRQLGKTGHAGLLHQEIGQ